MSSHDDRPAGSPQPAVSASDRPPFDQAGQLDAAVVDRLLTASRPPQPAPDAVRDHIRAAARLAWRQKVDARADPRGSEPSSHPDHEPQNAGSRKVVRRARAFQTEPRAASRRWHWSLAAALLVLATGVALVLRSGSVLDIGPSALEPRIGVAEVVARFPADSTVLPSLGSQLLSADTVTTAAGQLSLQLAGGASLRLDRESRVTLVSASVLELERGALYIDTGATARGQAQAPGIEVRTALGIARDIGTQFEVRLTADSLAVAVREGEVRVELDDQDVTAFAGDAVAVTTLGAIDRSSLLPTDPRWSWAIDAAPPLDIEGKPLLEVLEWVARETGWQLAFEDEALRSQAATTITRGSIEGLAPSQIPEIVVPVAGLDHRVDQRRMLTIVRPR